MIIWITGASSGLGLELARQYAEADALPILVVESLFDSAVGNFLLQGVPAARRAQRAECRCVCLQLRNRILSDRSLVRQLRHSLLVDRRRRDARGSN